MVLHQLTKIQLKNLFNKYYDKKTAFGNKLLIDIKNELITRYGN